MNGLQQGSEVLKSANTKLLLRLFMSFLKISPVTFGGGYAMLPLIEREIVERRRWLEEQEMHEVFTVAGSVPGAIAINSAAYVGYRLAGPWGAAAATIGVLLPTFLIVLLLSLFFLQIQHHPVVAAAFTGIRASVIALIAYAAFRFGRTAIVDLGSAALFILALVLLTVFDVHPLLIIIGGGVAGICLVYIRGRLGYGKRLQKKPPAKGQSSQMDLGEGI